MYFHLLLIPTFVAASTAAIAGSDQDACAERKGEKSIAACTRLISSGRLDLSDRVTTYVLRGTAYRANGQYDKAISDFNQAIDVALQYAPGEVAASALVVRANAYSLKGDFEHALVDYRAALNLNPNNEQAASEIKQIEEKVERMKQELALIPTAEPSPRVSARSELVGSVLIEEIKKGLKQVGCYTGRLDGTWAAAEVRSSVRFAVHTALSIGTDQPNTALLNEIRLRLGRRVCPLECTAREVEKNGSCIPKTCAARLRLNKDGECVALPSVKSVRRVVKLRKSGRRCFNLSGQSFCE